MAWPLQAKDDPEHMEKLEGKRPVRTWQCLERPVDNIAIIESKGNGGAIVFQCHSVK